jgi:hypothetical protein
VTNQNDIGHKQFAAETATFIERCPFLGILTEQADVSNFVSGIGTNSNVLVREARANCD